MTLDIVCSNVSAYPLYLDVILLRHPNNTARRLTENVKSTIKYEIDFVTYNCVSYTH